MRGRNLVAIHRSAVCPHLGQESGVRRHVYWYRMSNKRTRILGPNRIRNLTYYQPPIFSTEMLHCFAPATWPGLLDVENGAGIRLIENKKEGFGSSQFHVTLMCRLTSRITLASECLDHRFVDIGRLSAETILSNGLWRWDRYRGRKRGILVIRHRGSEK